jgi:hypothetical protein
VALAAPVLTAAERRRAPLLGVAVYWHLLSLDAPTVAVLWAWSLARAAQVRPSASAIAVLGIGTWLIYVADRLLDGRPGAPKLDLRERHFFHARHRHALLLAASFAAIPLLWLICARMPSAARRDDAVLFTLAMLYFAIVHWPGAHLRRWFPREFAVGILFACATAVPAWCRTRAAYTQLALPVLLFTALCCLNCIAIEIWEHPASLRRNFPVSPAAFCIAGASLALTVAVGLRDPAELRLAIAALLSALLLLTLDVSHRRAAQDPTGSRNHNFSVLALRIAADAALLTPLLLVLPWPR